MVLRPWSYSFTCGYAGHRGHRGNEATQGIKATKHIELFQVIKTKMIIGTNNVIWPTKARIITHVVHTPEAIMCKWILKIRVATELI